MIILIAGTTHTGKTVCAQRLLEKYHYPYISIDHLKMGLIRSGQTSLTVLEDEALTEYLWPIVREMIKTAVENNQNLIIEGGYIPFEWQRDFEPRYLEQIRYICLIMSRKYIESHFADILFYANVIEQRLDDSDLERESLCLQNEKNLSLCIESRLPYVYIDNEYMKWEDLEFI